MGCKYFVKDLSLTKYYDIIEIRIIKRKETLLNN